MTKELHNLQKNVCLQCLGLWSIPIMSYLWMLFAMITTKPQMKFTRFLSLKATKCVGW